MKLYDLEDLMRERFTEEEIAELRADAHREVIKLTLANLRKTLGITQTELAKRVDMAQAQVSKMESRDDLLLSTLRKVVEGLGGKLRISAEFGDHSYRIRLGE